MMGYIESLKHAADYTVIKKTAEITILETAASLILIGLPALFMCLIGGNEDMPIYWMFLLTIVLQVILVGSVIRLIVMDLPRRKDLLTYGWLYMVVGVSPFLVLIVLAFILQRSEGLTCGCMYFIPVSLAVIGYGFPRITKTFSYLPSLESLPDKESLIRLESMMELIKKTSPSTSPEVVEIIMSKAKYRLKPAQKHLIVCRFADFDDAIEVVPAQDFHLDVPMWAVNGTFLSGRIPVEFSWKLEEGRSSLTRKGTITVQDLDKFHMWYKELFMDNDGEVENNSDSGGDGESSEESEET